MSNDTDKTTYTVLAKRWDKGWELHIEGIGVTQSRTLNDAEVMARDYISLDTGAAPGSFAVEIVPEVETGLDRETQAARRAVAEADKAQRAAAVLSRQVAHRLKNAGLSGKEIAVVLRVSPQRVSQLLDLKGTSQRVHSAKALFPRASGKMRAAVKEHDRRIHS